MLLRAVCSEWLKLRRTPAAWLTVFFPVICMVGIGWYLSASHRLDWNNLLQYSYGFWITLWPAGGVALQAALAADIDIQENGWRALRMRPVAPETLFGAKMLAQGLHLLLHSLLISSLIPLTGALLRVPGEVPWSLLLLLALSCTFLTLPLQVLYVWFATAKGIGMSIGLGVVGLLLGALLGGTSMGERIWPFVPWAWPMRLFMVFSTIWINLHGDFTSPRVQLGLGLVSIPLLATPVLLVGIVIASLRWFGRQEEEGDMV
jgi:ABC-2 type transport system permease protein